MSRHYLDHASTTPVLPEVVDAVSEQMRALGNPSSLHGSGRQARRVVEEARESIAASLGARPSEVVLTSGGTEGANLAVVGCARARRAQEPGRRRVLCSTIEHHAVLDAVEHLVRQDDASVTWVEADAHGRVTPEAFAAALGEGSGEDVALATVMWANNEVGTVQPVAEIAALGAQHGIPLHTDAVQAVGHLPVDIGAAGVPLVSLTGHKIGGPVGTGALVVARDIALQPLSYGGGQERGIRSGTVDAPGARGLALALELLVARREAETRRLTGLRDALLAGALAAVPEARVTGAWEPGDASSRLAGHAHLTIPGCDGDSLLYLLDAQGVEVSTGSACTAGVPRPSHVLLAMGLGDDLARGALRVTLGHTSTQADVEAFLAALPGAVRRARAARAAG